MPPGGEHGQAGEQGQVVGAQVEAGAAGGLVVAGRVQGDCHRDDAEQRDEHARQAGHLQLQGAADDGRARPGATTGVLPYTSDQPPPRPRRRRRGRTGRSRPAGPGARTRPAIRSGRRRARRRPRRSRMSSGFIGRLRGLRVGDERQARCPFREPADGHAEAVQQRQRAGRAAGDPHVDREDLVDARRARTGPPGRRRPARTRRSRRRPWARASPRRSCAPPRRTPGSSAR